MLQWLIENYMIVLAALVGVLGAVLMVLKAIPGDQPGESMLERLVAVLKKFLGQK